jgi:hypothetical protein
MDTHSGSTTVWRWRLALALGGRFTGVVLVGGVVPS